MHYDFQDSIMNPKFLLDFFFNRFVVHNIFFLDFFCARIFFWYLPNPPLKYLMVCPLVENLYNHTHIFSQIIAISPPPPPPPTPSQQLSIGHWGTKDGSFGLRQWVHSICDSMCVQIWYMNVSHHFKKLTIEAILYFDNFLYLREIRHDLIINRNKQWQPKRNGACWLIFSKCGSTVQRHCGISGALCCLLHRANIGTNFYHISHDYHFKTDEFGRARVPATFWRGSRLSKTATDSKEPSPCFRWCFGEWSTSFKFMYSYFSLWDRVRCVY